MKRFLIFLLVILAALPVSACQSAPKSRTAEFYYNINLDSYYYKGTVTKNGSTYTYTQAIKDGIETTIEDYANDNYDKYVITEGNLMHSLDRKNKRYDTLQSSGVTHFLFAENKYSDFNNPVSATTVYVSSTPYFCETFNTIDVTGKITGSVKYYFQNEELAAVEWYTGEQITALLVMIEYSETLPENILTAIPEGYAAGTFSAEQDIDSWEDIE